MFDMIPLAIHMKRKTTAFACPLIMICFCRMISSILAPGTINLKVRLDVFSIYSNRTEYFYREKENSLFYKEIKSLFFEYIFP